MSQTQCNQPMDTYSRIVGYFSPLRNWHTSKREEFKMRKTYDLNKAIAKCDGDNLCDKTDKGNEISQFTTD